MLPVIALVGRPNVGKSTLFNRFTKTRAALVSDVSGLTRDRQYGIAQHQEKSFIVVDTGGFDSANPTMVTTTSSAIPTLTAKQSWQAIDEAQIVLFIVDARSGLTPIDAEIAQKLRKINKKIILVINKIDGLNIKNVIGDFYRFGLDEPFLISAEHGDGIKNLLDTVIKKISAIKPDDLSLDPEHPQITAENFGIKIAFIGRPNVGKSTLITRILGEERVIVSDQAGTTRDSIFINFTRRNKNYTLIDTAGIRRRGRVTDKIEKFSVIKTLQAIEATNVVVLLLDATENITEQDLHVLDFAIENGKAIVLAVNKWDGLKTEQRSKIHRELDRRLSFIDFAPIHFISALHGTGVGNLFPSIDKGYASAMRQLKTPEVTKILIQAVTDFPPPMVKGRRIKLRYAHVGGHNPPIIVIHGNQTENLPESYRKYLEHVFRRKLKLVGTPIRIELKTVHNPYSNKR